MTVILDRFPASSFLARKGYLIEEIYSSIDLALLWLDYYLALFTIASIKPLYSELYDFNNKDNNK